MTGASGLLGTWLLRTAPDANEIVALIHRQPVLGWPTISANIRDAGSVRAAFDIVQPSMVVHAAYALDEATIVDGTRHIADAAQNVGAEILYISTDAVFAGDGEPRDESASPDPVWDYGLWKAQAEELASAAASASIVRLPLVVSLDPEDHVLAQIRSGADRDETTTWFDDETRQPALAAELAETLWEIAALTVAERAGVWHLPGPESLTRYEIAERIVTELNLDPGTIVAGSSAAHASRPRHINMTDTRARHHVAWSPSRVLS